MTHCHLRHGKFRLIERKQIAGNQTAIDHTENIFNNYFKSFYQIRCLQTASVELYFKLFRMFQGSPNVTLIVRKNRSRPYTNERNLKNARLSIYKTRSHNIRSSVSSHQEFQISKLFFQTNCFMLRMELKQMSGFKNSSTVNTRVK